MLLFDVALGRYVPPDSLDTVADVTSHPAYVLCPYLQYWISRNAFLAAAS